MPLPPLSVAAVRTLAADQALDAEALHRQTGGNPFFVTEALASRAAGIPPPCGTPCSPGPPACRPRAGPRWRRPPSSARRSSRGLLGALVADVRATGDRRVHRARDAAAARATCSRFRHELARQAILDTIAAAPPARAPCARAARAALAPPVGAPDLARLAHHGEGAADARAVLAHAPAAAARAAALGAHREAADQYAPRAALRRRARRRQSGRGCWTPTPTSASIVDRLDEAIRAHARGAEALPARAGTARRKAKPWRRSRPRSCAPDATRRPKRRAGAPSRRCSPCHAARRWRALTGSRRTCGCSTATAAKRSAGAVAPSRWPSASAIARR